LKSLLSLWQKLAVESANRCCTSATQDRKTVLFRFEHEGLSFITITLPNFGKDFETSLDQGYVDRSLFTGFQWKGGLPRFLGGFLDRVFDRDSGVLLTSPDIDAILAVRQLTLLCGKAAFPCSDTRVKQAMSRFVECEQEVRISDERRSVSDMRSFTRISDLLLHKFSLTWTARSTTLSLCQSTVQVPLRINLRETKSLTKVSGPTA
jgi:hypothetical protein